MEFALGLIAGAVWGVIGTLLTLHLHRTRPARAPRCPHWDICDCNPFVVEMIKRGRWRGVVHVHHSPAPGTSPVPPPPPPMALS